MTSPQNRVRCFTVLIMRYKIPCWSTGKKRPKVSTLDNCYTVGTWTSPWISVHELKNYVLLSPWQKIKIFSPFIRYLFAMLLVIVGEISLFNVRGEYGHFFHLPAAKIMGFVSKWTSRHQHLTWSWKLETSASVMANSLAFCTRSF